MYRSKRSPSPRDDPVSNRGEKKHQPELIHLQWVGEKPNLRSFRFAYALKETGSNSNVQCCQCTKTIPFKDFTHNGFFWECPCTAIQVDMSTFVRQSIPELNHVFQDGKIAMDLSAIGDWCKSPQFNDRTRKPLSGEDIQANRALDGLFDDIQGVIVLDMCLPLLQQIETFLFGKYKDQEYMRRVSKLNSYKNVIDEAEQQKFVRFVKECIADGTWIAQREIAELCFEKISWLEEPDKGQPKEGKILFQHPGGGAILEPIQQQVPLLSSLKDDDDSSLKMQLVAMATNEKNELVAIIKLIQGKTHKIGMFLTPMLASATPNALKKTLMNELKVWIHDIRNFDEHDFTDLIEKTMQDQNKVPRVNLITKPGFHGNYIIFKGVQYDLATQAQVSWRESKLILVCDGVVDLETSNVATAGAIAARNARLRAVFNSYGDVGLMVMVFLFAFIAFIFQSKRRHRNLHPTLLLIGPKNAFKTTLLKLAAASIGNSKAIGPTDPPMFARKKLISEVVSVVEDLRGLPNEKFQLCDFEGVIRDAFEHNVVKAPDGSETIIETALMGSLNQGPYTKLLAKDMDGSLFDRLTTITLSTSPQAMGPHVNDLCEEEQHKILLSFALLPFDPALCDAFKKILPYSVQDRQRIALAQIMVYSTTILSQYDGENNAQERIEEFVAQHMCNARPPRPVDPDIATLSHYLNDNNNNNDMLIKRGNNPDVRWVPLKQVYHQYTDAQRKIVARHLREVGIIDSTQPEFRPQVEDGSKLPAHYPILMSQLRTQYQGNNDDDGDD